jgi:hypothetical protein
MSKLFNIQQKLKAPKNLKNDFAGFNYRSAEQILETLKPLLKEEGCHVVLTDEMVNLGDRFYVKAGAILVDDEKDIASAAGWAREQETKKGMDEAQITGSASSYARKYALCGLFAIDAGNDPDSHDNTQQGANVGEITPKQTNWLTKLAEANGYTSMQQMANEHINRNVVSKEDATALIDQLKIDGIINE